MTTSECARVTAKKYTSRPSPPYHAANCKGQTKEGNDKQLYKSVPDKRGVYTWKVVTKGPSHTRKASMLKGQKYETHDNSLRPFLLHVNSSSKTIDIYKRIYPKDFKKPAETVFYKTFKFKEIWIGNDPKYPEFKGNSVLIQLPSKEFMFIGHKIFTFSLMPEDSPVRYYSPMGNNDVPYPYLVGKTHTYYMIEDKIVPNDWLDLKRDAYSQLYAIQLGPKGAVDSVTKKLKTKLIHKRII